MRLAINKLKFDLRDEFIKWVDLDNLHLTLWFFGNVEIERIPLIIEQLEWSAARFFPFQISISGAGSFGTGKNPSVLWFGIQEPKQENIHHPAVLRSIFDDLKTRLKTIGFLQEERELKPHLTIARIKRIKDACLIRERLDEFKNLNFQVTDVNSFILYESILKTYGPEYRIIQQFPLVNTDVHFSNPATGSGYDPGVHPTAS